MDYIEVATFLLLSPSSPSQSISLVIFMDNEVESDETFFITLTLGIAVPQPPDINPNRTIVRITGEELLVACHRCRNIDGTGVLVPPYIFYLLVPPPILMPVCAYVFLLDLVLPYPKIIFLHPCILLQQGYCFL